jgi:hypothetical protein
VEQAIAAVPQGTARANLDADALAEPLKDPAIYETCKPLQSDHFNFKIAVWDGRAVGVDVTTKPKKPKLEACLRGVIEKIEWKAKAKSLNTVEYAL